MAETRGLCHICGKIAAHACRLCGRQACDQHFDTKLGMCASCKHGRMMKK